MRYYCCCCIRLCGIRASCWFLGKKLICLKIEIFELRCWHLFFFFFFFSSCFMSICNPVGYDRPERLYIQNSSPAWRPLIVQFRVVSPRLTNDIWGFRPPDSVGTLFYSRPKMQIASTSTRHKAVIIMSTKMPFTHLGSTRHGITCWEMFGRPSVAPASLFWINKHVVLL